MGLDARVRYTKMVIKDALIALLREKPLNKVTVKEICGLAEINRATFYKYYSDPFDLMDKIEQEFLTRLRNSLHTKHRSVREVFLFLLENIRTDGEQYQTLFSEHGDSKFPSRMFALCYEHAELGERFPSLSPVQLEWLYYFTAQGCCGILERWISSGMKEDPEEVAGFADRLVAAIESGL